ncbi:GDSL-type esterase/lipase family protein [Streptomyces sp. ME01-24h]|nr:GDSL-type esterase/lipase family protein [Streptomyces sp. ME19-03-3]MDX3357795.1 GDSL-type esterase/lipase family protein [Streptomyces sp. ME01-24h]
MRQSLPRGVAGALVGLATLLTTALAAGCSAVDRPSSTEAGAAGRAGAVQRPAQVWDTRPASLAALGDSITRAFDACGILTDCPDLSWATGSRRSVASVAARVLAKPASQSWNLAASGAKMRDLPAQAKKAVGLRPQQVTILMGANDACARSTDRMTPVAEYRRDFSAALRTLSSGLPKAQVFVASVPDLMRLWEVGRQNVLGRQVWKLGLCPSMLGDAESMSTAAQKRRQTVRERVMAYNAALRQECARHERCRYDGGVVFDYRFTRKELSPWDWFHPSEEGQAKLAGLVYAAAFGPGSAGR